MAAEQVTGGTTVGHVEFDTAPSALLAYRYPGVPNLHDVTAVDWDQLWEDNVMARGAPRNEKRAHAMKLRYDSGLSLARCAKRLDCDEEVVPSDSPAVDVLTAGYP